MKVLSVKNPWAYLIFHERKDVENRTYPTNFRGELLIHASKRSMDFGNCLALMPQRFSLGDIINLRARADQFNGFILGSVRLADCVRNSRSEWAEKGCWHWVLENPVLLSKPVRADGKLGFWNAAGIPPEEERRVK
jgi:hypothetical protein